MKSCVDVDGGVGPSWGEGWGGLWGGVGERGVPSGPILIGRWSQGGEKGVGRVRSWSLLLLLPIVRKTGFAPILSWALGSAEVRWQYLSYVRHWCCV